MFSMVLNGSGVTKPSDSGSSQPARRKRYRLDTLGRVIPASFAGDETAI